MYSDQASLDIVRSVAKVTDARSCSAAQAVQVWILRKPEISSMLAGTDSVAQFDSAVAALETELTAEKVNELERNYTPCDVINDYAVGKRTPRTASPYTPGPASLFGLTPRLKETLCI